MRRIGIIAIALLLVWNIVLTLSLVDLSRKSRNNSGNNVIREATTDIASDFTQIMKNNREKVVAIRSETRNQYTYSSGILYGKNEEGGYYVLCSARLIGEDGSNRVYFANRDYCDAQLVGADTASDIAILLIQPDFGSDIFTIGDSSLSKDGEWVLTIGNNLSSYVFGEASQGILASSARYLRRDTDADGVYDYDCPQMELTATIENSCLGGAVINLAGELIGMMTSVASHGTMMIPSSEIKLIADQLIRGEKVRRQSLKAYGRNLADIPLYLLSYYHVDLTLQKGVLITEVFGGNDLRVGDVIVSIDDRSVNYKDYRNWLYQAEAGSHKILVRRGQDTVELTVEVSD